MMYSEVLLICSLKKFVKRRPFNTQFLLDLPSADLHYVEFLVNEHSPGVGKAYRRNCPYFLNVQLIEMFLITLYCSDISSFLSRWGLHFCTVTCVYESKMDSNIIFHVCEKRFTFHQFNL